MQNIGHLGLAALRAMLWPDRCPLCAERTDNGRAPGFCPACAKSVTAFQPPACSLCGRPFHYDNAPAGMVCGFCSLAPPVYDAGRAYGAYSGNLAEGIRRFKYNNNRNQAAAFARLMREADALWLGGLKADAVVPIPLHPRRLCERGFNQAVDLARPVARARGIPLIVSALARVRDTKPQFGLTVAQRRDNVRGAFQVRRPDLLRGRSVILVDDVITTGATASECARALKKAGAKSVTVLALARAV